MDCQPLQPQAGKAPLKRGLEDRSNLKTSPAKSQQRSARLRSSRADAAPQRRCNLDALPDDLLRRVLDTLSRKDVGAAAATCERFAKEWRRAAGARAVLFPGLSREGCTKLRRFVGDAYASCDDLSTEAEAQDFLARTFSGRFDSQVQSKSCFDLFYGPPGSHFVRGVEVKICHYNSSRKDWDPTLAFWGEDEALAEIYVGDKDHGAHVAESVIY